MADHLLVTEYPHRGEPRTWEARDEEDFVLRVLQANPRADLDPFTSYAQAVQWLRSDLRDLSIEAAS